MSGVFRRVFVRRVFGWESFCPHPVVVVIWCCDGMADVVVVGCSGDVVVVVVVIWCGGGMASVVEVVVDVVMVC